MNLYFSITSENAYEYLFISIPMNIIFTASENIEKFYFEIPFIPEWKYLPLQMLIKLKRLRKEYPYSVRVYFYIVRVQFESSKRKK